MKQIWFQPVKPMLNVPKVIINTYYNEMYLNSFFKCILNSFFKYILNSFFKCIYTVFFIVEIAMARKILI